MRCPLPCVRRVVPRAKLEAWAAAIRAVAPQVEATFVYFNNDEKAYAPRNAATLRALLGV